MALLSSKISPASDEFKANEAAMAVLVADLNQKRAAASLGGA